MTRSKVVDDDVVRHVKSDSTLVIGGSGGGLVEPTLLIKSLAEHYQQTGTPCNLTIMHSSGLGDNKEGGLGHLAQEGLIGRVIGGHWGMSPKMVELAQQNRIKAYNLPQGIISQLYREIAAKRPGLITTVGLHTFVDPRLEGGRLNAETTEDLVRLIRIDDREYLYYPAIETDYAFLRGTTADEDGNIAMEKEGAFLENLAIAQAVHNCGGTVIVQVERVVKKGSLKAKEVKIPGILVDYVVIDPAQTQTCVTEYNPGYSGEYKVPETSLSPMQLSHRKVIARRASLELVPGCVNNLGVGMADGVAHVAAEEGIYDRLDFVIEQGLVGGIPAPGVEFGAALNPDAIIDAPSQFDFFDGGGIDIAFLGMAQIDRLGNVNVSKFGSRIAGCGGFINISQNARKVVFCGTLTSAGLRTKISQGKIEIIQEGKFRKFVNQLDQVTFSGKNALNNHQEVLCVTERAVFRLTDRGLQLIEVAPGIELHRDVLDVIDFEVEVAKDLKTMDTMIFVDSLMGLSRIYSEQNKGWLP